LSSASCSLGRNKDNANRLSNLKLLPGRGQPAGLSVDTEDYDVVGILVGCNQVLAGGINGEITWRFAVR
jgi:hypothetical protein